MYTYIYMERSVTWMFAPRTQNTSFIEFLIQVFLF